MIVNLKHSPFHRCGSYPFMNIAQDFGLPYGVVLRYAEYYRGIVGVMTTDDANVLYYMLNTTLYRELTKRIANATRNQRNG